VFHRYGSWFVRYRDDVRQPDGTVKYVQVCKKLDVENGGEYRTKASVRPFVLELLGPLNSARSGADSRQTFMRSAWKIKRFRRFSGTAT
jgi:hypothetical protein